MVHKPAFVHYQSKDNFTFYLLNHSTKSVEAQLTIFIDRNTATTALKSPFGFFELNEFREEYIVSLLKEIELFCRSLLLKKLIIKCHPEFYNKKLMNETEEALKRVNFKKTETLQNSHVCVDAREFQLLIAPAQRGRMQKTINSGFVASQVGRSKLKEVYEFIYQCRLEKGYLGLVSFDELDTLIELFPENYFLFVVRDNEGRIAAANISVRIREDILYTWYTQNLEIYRSFSPVVLLHKYIYDFCRENNINYIDLSVAKDGEGGEKTTLQKFKKRLGGMKSNRTVFEKRFDE